MKVGIISTRNPGIIAGLCLATVAYTQGPGNGFGGPGGRSGFGGMNQHVKILAKYDKDGDGRLNAEERKAAQAGIASGQSGPRRGRGGFGFGGIAQGPVAPGPRLKPSDVKSYSTEPLYDPKVLRTIFLEFEDADWEQEMADFYHTDVDLPAKMIVDGKTYKEAGVHFRGASSFMMVPTGQKRSLSISMNYLDADQRLGGHKSMDLLNAVGEPTFLRTVLYLQIARQYMPAPKANFMRS